MFGLWCGSTREVTRRTRRCCAPCVNRPPQRRSVTKLPRTGQLEEPDRFRIEAAEGVLQYPCRRGVEPLHVFDGNDQRTCLGEHPKRPQDWGGYRPLVRWAVFHCRPEERDLEGLALGFGKLQQHPVGDTSKQIAKPGEGQLCLGPGRPR